MRTSPLKSERLINFIQITILCLFIVSLFYFWKSANDWENLLAKDWTTNPTLSNASATLEYLKALVKTVMLSGVVIISMIYLKNYNNHTKDD